MVSACGTLAPVCGDVGKISEKMTNFTVYSRGAIFALIWSFQCSPNSSWTTAWGIKHKHTYLQSPRINSLLIVEAKEESRGKRTASYRMRFFRKMRWRSKNTLCQALVYQKDKPLSFLEEKVKLIYHNMKGGNKEIQTIDWSEKKGSLTLLIDRGSKCSDETMKDEFESHVLKDWRRW